MFSRGNAVFWGPTPVESGTRTAYLEDEMDAHPGDVAHAVSHPLAVAVWRNLLAPIAESGGLGRWEALDEEGAEGLVLSMGGVGGLQEAAGER